MLRNKFKYVVIRTYIKYYLFTLIVIKTTYLYVSDIIAYHLLIKRQYLQRI